MYLQRHGEKILPHAELDMLTFIELLLNYFVQVADYKHLINEMEGQCCDRRTISKWHDIPPPACYDLLHY